MNYMNIISSEKLWNSPTRIGLFANVAAASVTLLVINTIVFSFGLTKYSEHLNPSFAPPSFVIAAVWFVLFILNGVARWSLNGNASPKAIRLKSILVAIFLVNVTHPIYTAGFSLYIPALIGTIIPLIMVLYVTYTAWNINRLTSFLIAPMALWFCFAGTIILSALGWIPLR
jgi:tryptophan-rich sensory protein